MDKSSGLNSKLFIQRGDSDDTNKNMSFSVKLTQSLKSSSLSPTLPRGLRDYRYIWYFVNIS